ncbi:hypothetical protein GCM10010992_19970 [Cloacibacterium rupense]|uniref:HNH Cas9-type domain-containing protein n=1 Tax=Cloacibacterium rupense TaxID=517423 RepID=A0ABQ2NJQ9_9FLAO|nr:type II CRISPR RNA-guided endonuclease Cas9 [Cloacibacterium rupense]GGP05104.1 hypothetical protein GCM10010992_19970 [Cloacibacterium rupense]
MSNKKFGIDLGTNSYGWAIRNFDLEENQIEKAGVIRFGSGVGIDKSGSVFTFASVRTKGRGVRNRYKSEKNRKFELLKYLIKYKYVPLTENELKSWKNYVHPNLRTNEIISRKFPKENIKFLNWLQNDFSYLDFDEKLNIYEIRAKLVNEKIEDEILRKHLLGRVLYHIANHRGFKSSKKVKENIEDDNAEDDISLNRKNPIGAERKKASKIEEIALKYNVKTIGEAFAKEISFGNRVRQELQQYAIRIKQEEEVKLIFEKQGYVLESEEFKNLFKSVFFQKKLKSQKGNVGNCTLEKNKTRCYLSHYDFEEFSVREFLNNVRINRKPLTKNIKDILWNDFFLKRVKSNFKFSEIKEFLYVNFYCKETDYFNYRDKQTIGGCPISSYFFKIFGENWRDLRIETNLQKANAKRKDKRIIYNIEDVWHLLLDEEDDENLKTIFLNKYNFSEKQIIDLLKCSRKFEQGFASLSLNAIRKILVFLREDFDNVSAKLLANVPIVIGKEQYESNRKKIIEFLINIQDEVNFEKLTSNIVNELIYEWKNEEQKRGYRDVEYKLSNNVEGKDILNKLQIRFGKDTWTDYSEEIKKKYYNTCFNKFQFFFKTSKREFIKLPTLKDTFKGYLKNNFLSHFSEDTINKKLERIYHPSETIIYQKPENSDVILQLGSPKHPALKQPKALKSLHILKNHLNQLLKEEIIDSDTEIIIEIARELNDINRAWAIEQYQKKQEQEREEIKVLLEEYFLSNGLNVNPQSEDDNDKMRLAIEQIEMEEKDYDYSIKENSKTKEKKWDYFIKQEKSKIEKYVDKIKLWKEQNFRCIYTNKSISFKDLFNDRIVDFEHTIPYEISQDNSLRNKTLCYSHYNTNIKKAKIPTELIDDYETIRNNIEHWVQKVKFIEDRIEFWKLESKKAVGDKERKDSAIRERHLWSLELNYWKGKVEGFLVKEITEKWLNSQLVDTQIMTKYAYHFLKTIFNKVRVVKGNDTKEFRKILQVQPKEELEKNRTHHSHHAIDAAVLTLIPPSPEKERIKVIAEEFRKKYKKQYHDYVPYRNYSSEHVLKIKDEIIINYKEKDKIFSSFVKNLKKNGKRIPLEIYNKQTNKKEIVYQKNEKGEIEFRKYEDGNFIIKKDQFGNPIKDQFGGKIPIPEYKKMKGDGFRGSIFQDSFYSELSYFERDENGNFKFDKEGNHILKKNVIAKRIPIDDAKKKIDAIIDFQVKENVKKEIERIKEEENLLKDNKLELVDKKIYQLNRKGERVKDQFGKFITYRHVRCAIPNTKVVPIKNHLYGDNRHYLAQHEEVSLAAIYEIKTKNKIKRELKTLNPIHIAELKNNLNILDKKDFFEYLIDEKTGEIIYPKYVFSKKTKVLFYGNETIEDLKRIYNEGNIEDIQKRFFMISGIEENKAGKKIIFQNCFMAGDALKSLPKNLSELNLNENVETYKLSQGNWNFIMEGYDFKINALGEIEFK